MPHLRRRPMSCGRSHRCGPHIWIRTVQNQRSRERCASGASPWGAAGHDGLVPVRGNLLPEVAAQLQLGFDSVLNPQGRRGHGAVLRGRATGTIVTSRSSARRISGPMRRSSTTRSRCC